MEERNILDKPVFSWIITGLILYSMDSLYPFLIMQDFPFKESIKCFPTKLNISVSFKSNKLLKIKAALL